jgi:hypothetical protein
VDPDWRQRIAALGRGDVLAASVMTGAAITDALDASTVAREQGSYVVYVRPVERSVQVIAGMAARSRCDGVKLHDPNFFHGADRADLFAGLFAEQVGLPWAASLHPADLLACGDRSLERMAGAGLCRVLMGLESPVPELVRLAGKRALMPEISESRDAKRKHVQGRGCCRCRWWPVRRVGRGR